MGRMLVAYERCGCRAMVLLDPSDVVECARFHADATAEQLSVREEEHDRIGPRRCLAHLPDPGPRVEGHRSTVIPAALGGVQDQASSPISSSLGYAEDFKAWGLPLDRGISYAVKVLRDGGVETFESCEGGAGHAFPEPTIRFHGQPAAGYKAMAVALDHGLPVLCVRRAWSMQGGELVGPQWEMTFRSAPLAESQKAAERNGAIS